MCYNDITFYINKKNENQYNSINTNNSPIKFNLNKNKQNLFIGKYITAFLISEMNIIMIIMVKKVFIRTVSLSTNNYSF